MNRAKPNFIERYRQARSKGRSAFSAVFSSSWNSLGSLLGSYDAVDPRNKSMRGYIARPVSAADLASSTPYLRNLCRNFERNHATARAAVEGLVANIVGTGIALEPDTGNPETDKKLGAEWTRYLQNCFIDGTGMYEGQSLACREMVVAGEALWRLIVDPKRAQEGLIPLCIQPLEAEWLGDSGQTITGSSEGYLGGINLDQYGRAEAYNILAPSGKTESIPAKFIVHIFERRRALQLRGEPWLAPVLTTMRQEKDLVQAELEAAKNTAGFAAAVTSNGGVPLDLDEKGDPVRNIELGTIVDLQPGEDIKMLSHTRPSQQIAPFRKMLRGDIAAACRIGQRWLDRDISDANYTSIRADMLDSEKLLAPVRDWFGHQSIGRVYQAVLPYLALRAGVSIPDPRGYRLVPDGQPYVDPLKDVQAAAMASAYGMSNFSIEIGKRGGDYRKVWRQLADEKKELDAMDLVLQSPAGAPFASQDQLNEIQEKEAEILSGQQGKAQARGPDGTFA